MTRETGQARDCVAAWIRAHQDFIGSPPIKFARMEEPARILVVWYETPKYLIDICVWDHADCLDIGALDKATKIFGFAVSGSCEGTAGLTERLDSFLEWLELNEPDRNLISNPDTTHKGFAPPRDSG